MKRRGPNGTIQQRIFDVIVAHGGSLTHDEIIAETGITETSLRIALGELRKHIALTSCRQQTVYSIPLGTPRPADGRGMK